MTSRSLILIGLNLFVVSSAAARPTGPRLFCDTYPDSPTCTGRLAECGLCHTSTAPEDWNSFGYGIISALDGDFDEVLPAALAAIEAYDADGDGVPNLEEIMAGTGPGDATDFWLYCAPGPDTGALPIADDYDLGRAYQSVSVLFCGYSPSYEERTAFDALSREDAHARLHVVLDACLSSAYWRDEALPRLADSKIRPIGAVGINSTTGIVIGDYEWDYQLFSYVMTGERDVRDLLLADYHVRRNTDGTLERVEGTFDAPSGGAGGQPLVEERRAGMITSQWFLSVNTMFSPLPRTTAAQAYRAYLGMDIARQQGLVPVVGEPVDVDGKGVTDPVCAQCHSTLDPLSYAFAEYEGIRGAQTGVFDANRPANLMAEWSGNTTYLLGQQVDDVRGWAEHAVTTDEFKRNLAMLVFRYAERREPTPAEAVALEPAWQALPDDGWSMNRLIHRVVDTRTFGGAL